MLVNINKKTQVAEAFKSRNSRTLMGWRFRESETKYKQSTRQKSSTEIWRTPCR